MPQTVFDRLVQRLDAAQVPYKVLRHAPVFTSAEAAAVRGAPLASGAKALVCKGDDQFYLLALPADRKLASKRARASKGWRSLRFATVEEVQQLTGLQPGSIPPFGSLFGLVTLCDEALGDQAEINFNAGDHAISVNMRYDDWRNVERPEMGTYSDASAG